MRPHRQQLTRLPHPWDSPGKNTGVGCHFLLQSMKVKSESEVTQSCPTLHDPMDCSPPGSSVHGILQARVLEWVAIAFSELCCSNQQGKSESHSVVFDSLQPHGLYSPWNYPGQNTGVGTFPFFRGSSQPRDWTQVSHIAGRSFTSWATREAQEYWSG